MRPQLLQGRRCSASTWSNSLASASPRAAATQQWHRRPPRSHLHRTSSSQQCRAASPSSRSITAAAELSLTAAHVAHKQSHSCSPVCCHASNHNHDGSEPAPTTAATGSEQPDQSQGLQWQQQQQQQQPLASPPQSPQQHQQQPQDKVPTVLDGVNWYCYCCLGLLFLTDLTPLGQWLLAAAPAAGTGGQLAAAGFPQRLALLQWGAFVVPSLLWVQRQGWHLRNTLKLQPCKPSFYATGLLAGPVLWLCINAAIALRTGQLQHFTAALTGALPDPTAAAAAATGTAAAGAAASPGMLLLGVGSPQTVQSVLLLLVFAAVSPAVAEELLFRGLLLTAVQQRLGRIDAVAVVAALFALIHLDLQQFFLYCVLGGAAGLVTVRSGSVGPAVALHAAFNATAVAAGLLLHA